jgi:hypothetical protein
MTISKNYDRMQGVDMPPRDRLKKHFQLGAAAGVFVLLFALAGCSPDLKNMSEAKAKGLEAAAIQTLHNPKATPDNKITAVQDLKTLCKAATKKNRFAEYYLGQYKIMVHDKSSAAPLIQSAAGQGYVPAEYNLSRMYEQGYGPIKQDTTQQVVWLRKAAAGHWPAAEVQLAAAYELGKDRLTKNPQKSYPLMRAAAHDGNATAQFLLYNMYATGSNGAPKDSQKSDYWMHQIVQRKSPYASIVKEQQAQLAVEKEEVATNSGPDTGRFSTNCDNMDCVRRYSNGVVIHFVACMNPGDMMPMDSAPVVDGQGRCSGTDANGNFYGMGSMGGGMG